jgi:streptogramin lyase
MLGKRRRRRPRGRLDARTARRIRLVWADGCGSPRLEDRAMLTVSFTTIPIPLVELIEPDGIANGPDGNLWFTESGSGRIGQMTPAGVLTEFTLPKVPAPAGSPPGTAATTASPAAITAAPDGALWFTGIPGEVGRITTSGVVSEFAVPDVPPPAGSPAGTASTPATLSSITTGPDGALWFTGVPGEVGRITTSGVVSEFAVPDVPPPAGSPAGTASTPATLSAITSGPDGALWFSGVPGEVGRITTAGAVTEFAVPDIPPPAGSPAGTASTQATLSAITTGPDGALWFLGVSGEVGRITTAGVVSEFAEPEVPQPGGLPAVTPLLNSLTTGPDGNLWLTTQNYAALGADAIGRITPSGAFTFFNVPGNFAFAADVTTGPDGNIWFTEREDGATADQQPAVGEITPGGLTTLHDIPIGTTLDPTLGVGVGAGASTIAADGSLWFLENSAIGRMKPDGTFQQFPVALGSGDESLNQITSGRRGTVWFDISGQDANYDDFAAIGRIANDGAITTYAIPANTSVNDITTGRDSNVWFTETFSDPNTYANKIFIGQITPGGAIHSFAVHLPNSRSDNFDANQLRAIAQGPDGNIWFTGEYNNNQSKEQSFVGRITARGRVRLFELPSSLSVGSSSRAYNWSYPTATDSLISGPDGKLWFTAQNGKESGIARISTNGKLAPFIRADIYGDLNSGPDGRVWFYGSEQASPKSQLALATRSGIVVTRDLPQSSAYSYIGENYTGLAVGRDGSLVMTNASSSILRMSGQGGPIGGLDYRTRPKRAPDFVNLNYGPPYWTNVSGTAHPTFAGIARPGAEVTLWAQKQGESQPVPIGHVHASPTDGSWTLKSHVRLSDGSYALTASQKGDTGPPTMLYTLNADPSSVFAEPLVIDTKRATKHTGVG